MVTEPMPTSSGKPSVTIDELYRHPVVWMISMMALGGLVFIVLSLFDNYSNPNMMDRAPLQTSAKELRKEEFLAVKHRRDIAFLQAEFAESKMLIAEHELARIKAHIEMNRIKDQLND